MSKRGLYEEMRRVESKEVGWVLIRRDEASLLGTRTVHLLVAVDGAFTPESP